MDARLDQNTAPAAEVPPAYKEGRKLEAGSAQRQNLGEHGGHIQVTA